MCYKKTGNVEYDAMFFFPKTVAIVVVLAFLASIVGKAMSFQVRQIVRHNLPYQATWIRFRTTIIAEPVGNGLCTIWKQWEPGATPEYIGFVRCTELKAWSR